MVDVQATDDKKETPETEGGVKATRVREEAVTTAVTGRVQKNDKVETGSVDDTVTTRAEPSGLIKEMVEGTDNADTYVWSSRLTEVHDLRRPRR